MAQRGRQATYFDLLPRDVLATLIRRCEYHRSRNAARLVLPESPLYGFLPTTVQGLQICDAGCRYDGSDTLTLDANTTAQDAKVVLTYVGRNVQRLVLYSAKADYAQRFKETIVHHCPKLDTLVIHWIRDGSSLTSAYAFNAFVRDVLGALGERIHRIVLEDVAGVETDVLDCIADNCCALHDLVLNGDVISKLCGMESYVRWGTVARNIRTIQVNGFSSYSWHAPLFLGTLALKCPQLTTLRLDADVIPKSLGQILAQLYLERGSKLKEAAILDLAPGLIRQVMESCPNLVKCTVREEDPLFPRIHLLRSTIKELHLLMRIEYDADELGNAMNKCLTIERLHFNTIVPGSCVVPLFCRMLPRLHQLSLQVYPDLITADNLSLIAAVTCNLRILNLGRLEMNSLQAIEQIASSNKHLSHVHVSVSLCRCNMPIKSAALLSAAQVDKSLRESLVLEEILYDCEHDLGCIMKNDLSLLHHAFRNSLRREVRVHLSSHFLL